MSPIAYAWIATFFYGLEVIVVKLTGKYGIKNQWLFNLLWNIVWGLMMIPFFFTQKITWPTIWPNLLISAFLCALSNILYVYLLGIMDVSVLSPLFNFRTVFAVILSVLLLGEKLSLTNMIYTIIIFFAGFFVTMDEKFSFKSFFKKEIAFVLFYMIILAFYNIFTKKTIIDLGYWNATVWVIVLATLFTLPTHFLVRKEYKTVTFKKIGALILVGIVGIIGYLASNRAYEHSVSITALIMSLPTSMIIAFVMSLFAPKLLEKHSAKVYLIRFVAAAVMLFCAIKIS